MKRISVSIDERQCAELERKNERDEIDNVSEGVRNALSNSSYGSSNFRKRCDYWGSAFGTLGLLILALAPSIPYEYRTLVVIPFGVSFVFYSIGFLNEEVIPEIKNA